MASKEIPSNGDYLGKWTHEGIDQLDEFLNTFRPTLQSLDTKDPFELAQYFQHSIDQETSPHFRIIMGMAGKETLNKAIPTKMIFNRMAIVADRLFALTDSDDESERWAEGYAGRILISGSFDMFEFGHSDSKDRLSVELILPKFLKPRLDQESERFASANRFAIPVEAIGARMFEPSDIY